jgi:group I intron endonuclease
VYKKDMENITKNNIKSGIYAIINTVNGNRYVGSAVNLRKRKAQHKLNLGKGTHKNIILQNAWNKHGSDNFMFVVLEYCPADFLLKKEQYHLDLRADYNICPTAGNTLGMKHTDAAKEKIKESKKNLSAESRERMSIAHKGKQQGKDNPCFGRKHTPEECEKISAAQMGRAGTFLGKKHTEETKKKISEIKTGVKLSGKTRAKMSASHKGMLHTPEERLKIGRALKGRIFSIETIEKMRMAALNRYSQKQARITAKGPKMPDMGVE